MAKAGLDDYFLTHTKKEFDRLPRLTKDEAFGEDIKQAYWDWVGKKKFEESIPQIGTRRRDDIGNGERFVDLNGAVCRWSAELGWRFFDDKRWRDNALREIERRAETTARAIFVEASRTRDRDLAEKLGSWAAQSASAGKIKAMIESAKNKPGIAVAAADFDKNPWLLNLNNGTLNLETGEFYEHRKDDFITKITHIDYDRSAQCPLWINFLAQIIPDPDDRRFLQKAVGYSLTGSTREQCFFILYGTGSNGKSTFLNTIDALMGEYAEQTNSETLMVKQSGSTIPNDIAKLAGARFVSAIETEGNKRLAESLIKRMTGGDKLSARFLNHEFFTFTPTFKLWLAVNHAPKISGTDEGIWRRIRLIPFSVEIPVSNQDQDLPKKLLAELQGILAWAIDGAAIWLSEKLGLTPKVSAATKKYRIESDILNAFLEECCNLDPDAEITKAELYEKYYEWAKKGGEGKYILTKRSFGTRISEKGFQDKKNVAWFWLGIDLQRT